MEAKYWARSIRDGFLEKGILKLNFEKKKKKKAGYSFLRKEEKGEFSKIGDAQEQKTETNTQQARDPSDNSFTLNRWLHNRVVRDEGGEYSGPSQGEL